MTAGANELLCQKHTLVAVFDAARPACPISTMIDSTARRERIEEVPLVSSIPPRVYRVHYSKRAITHLLGGHSTKLNSGLKVRYKGSPPKNATLRNWTWPRIRASLVDCRLVITGNRLISVKDNVMYIFIRSVLNVTGLTTGRRLCRRSRLHQDSNAEAPIWCDAIVMDVISDCIRFP